MESRFEIIDYSDFDCRTNERAQKKNSKWEHFLKETENEFEIFDKSKSKIESNQLEKIQMTTSDIEFDKMINRLTLLTSQVDLSSNDDKSKQIASDEFINVKNMIENFLYDSDENIFDSFKSIQAKQAMQRKLSKLKKQSSPNKNKQENESKNQSKCKKKTDKIDGENVRASKTKAKKIKSFTNFDKNTKEGIINNIVKYIEKNRMLRKFSISKEWKGEFTDQELLLIKKTKNRLSENQVKKRKLIVLKLNKNNYEIDPDEFDNYIKMTQDLNFFHFCVLSALISKILFFHN